MSMLSTGGYPTWLPKSVAMLSEAHPLKNDVSRRLLTDPRMKDVWTYLISYEPKQAFTRLANCESRFRFSSWDLDDQNISASDQLCGVYFLHVLTELCLSSFTATRAQVDELAEPWFEAARICQVSLDTIMFRPLMESDVQSVKRTIKHLTGIANLLQHRDNPRILDKNSNNREDNLPKSNVRALANITRSIFGKVLAGILAKTVTVGLDLNPALERRHVEAWVKDLPSPI